MQPGTTYQHTEFMNLVIRAVATDDHLTPAQALARKREQNLSLSAPEVIQVLEFAKTRLYDAPALSLYTVLFLTDDVYRLQDGKLRDLHREILRRASDSLGIDPQATWDDINAPPPSPNRSQHKPTERIPLPTQRMEPPREAPRVPPTVRLPRPTQQMASSPSSPSPMPHSPGVAQGSSGAKPSARSRRAWQEWALVIGLAVVVLLTALFVGALVFLF